MAQEDHHNSGMQLFVLTVNMFQGNDLPIGDMDKDDDPGKIFAVTKIQTEEWKTEEIKRNENPQWNESKVFCFLTAPETIEFTINAKDEEENEVKVGTGKFNCMDHFKDLYRKAQHQQKKMKDSHSSGGGSNGVDPTHGHDEEITLSSKHTGSVTIELRKVENMSPSSPKTSSPSSSSSSIDICIECEILFPLETQRRLIMMNDCSETLKRLENEKLLVNGNLTQNDQTLMEKEKILKGLNSSIKELETEKISLENKKGELEKEATESKKRNEEKTNEMSSMKHTNQQWGKKKKKHFKRN